ncbi:Homologous-pairing protein 2 [Trebouxia sp. C0010 RCD-2024]
MYLVTWLTWQCLQIGPLQQKLAKLQSGSVLITKEERESVEKGLQKYLDAWAQRRRIFKNIWGDISENVDQNQKAVFEEMGVQTDEDLEVSHEAFSKLQMKRRRM